VNLHFFTHGFIGFFEIGILEIGFFEFLSADAYRSKLTFTRDSDRCN
jgi:hypothetical protein